MASRVSRRCVPLRTHVANFQNPVARQFPLDAQVPLLRAGRNKMPRHFEAEEVDEIATVNSIGMLRIAERIGETVVEHCLRRRVRGRISVSINETEEMRIHRHISRIDLATYRQPPHARGKNIRHVAGSSDRSGNRQNRRAERKLVYRAHILAHIEDAVAASDGSGVISEQVPGKTERAGPSWRRSCCSWWCRWRFRSTRRRQAC